MSSFFDVIKKNAGLVMSYLLLGIVIVFCETFSVNLFQRILDSITLKSVDIGEIILYSTLLILGYILNYVDNYPTTKLSSKIYLDFKINAIRKIRTIDYKEYQKLGTGKILQLIENGSNAGRNILFEYGFRIIRELIPSLMFSLFFIAQIDIRIMYIIFVGYILVFIVTNILLKCLYSVKKEVLINEEGFNRKLTRGFMELVVFRIYRRFENEIKQCVNMEDNIVRGKSKLVMIHEAFFTAFAVLIGIVKIIILCAQFLGWNLSVGEIVALLTLVDKAYTPIAIFNVIYIEKKLEQIAYERYKEFLDLPNDTALEQVDNNKIENYNIEIKGLCYSYNKRQVVNNIDINVKTGEAVAFVGESGSGKSTIIKLILGLLKYQNGSIKIGGIELSKLNLNKFYTKISYISQDSPIFDGTIRENIVFDRKIKDEDIMKVLDLVELKEYVCSLPEGLDTEIGEKGQMLSGGEKQRLALARVFFDESELIILDEATSAMDNLTESAIMNNILKYFSNRTLLIIAHRLNSIEKVDRIYAIKDANLIAEGTFAEMLDKSEYFKQLWTASQSEDYK
ncbi:ABC transporter ATP-binding protein [Gallintestinimicrobium propionicum]|uniref:ABC transporter ATP-binding protein/permease n=1 Tax=Gallintestinimicrobium propionicum TaxID=2981770 RepID=A0AAE3AXI4_9FIRM|nr:ABC transporter ATP-binding protein [Gallintestinimicrobium propionicum]MCC2168670.1 ABC transporter ATP-binding protein/permease [Gallintestinimicrobium propionicum]